MPYLGAVGIGLRREAVQLRVSLHHIKVNLLLRQCGRLRRTACTACVTRQLLVLSYITKNASVALGCSSLRTHPLAARHRADNLMLVR